jgi:hypothetical protein
MASLWVSFRLTKENEKRERMKEEKKEGEGKL